MDQQALNQLAEQLHTPQTPITVALLRQKAPKGTSLPMLIAAVGHAKSIPCAGVEAITCGSEAQLLMHIQKLQQQIIELEQRVSQLEAQHD